MPNTGQSVKGIAGRAQPGIGPDNVESELRTTVYGDLVVSPLYRPTTPLADEGAYFVTTNPTPGTTIATGAAVQQTFSDTVPMFVIKNNAPTTSNKRVYLDYIKVVQIGGTAPASQTSLQYAIKIDSGNRVPTAGSSTLTPVNPNMDSTAGSAALVYVPNAANITAPAAVSARLIGRGQLKNGITVVLDEYLMAFGSVDAYSSTQGATALGKFAVNCPPVVIGPQQFALIHWFFPAGITNAFTFEFEMGHWER